MSGAAIGLTGIAFLIVLLALRVPVALAMIGVGTVGLWGLLSPSAALGILGSVPYEFAGSWTLSAVPMFLLMGYVCFYSGMTSSLFGLARAVLGRIPGALALASILGCTGFATVCGSSIACAAAMGRIAIPEMVRAGYGRNFACGAVAAGGTIGALVPPSIVLILFGIFTQTSIIDLFLGGIGVGLLTALGYAGVVLLTSLFNPAVVPRTLEPAAPGEAMRHLRELWVLLVLVICVFGGLFAGVFTTTEAGAAGATFACLIALFQGRLSRDLMVRALTETVVTCGTLFIVGAGAVIFTRFISISGAGSLISSLVIDLDLSYWQLMAMIVVIYLILGMFVDGIGAMLLTLPIFLPIIGAQHLDKVWFGVLLAKLIEIGMLTPPFGINVFVIKSVVGDLTDTTGIFRGVMRFILVDILVIAACIAWPGIVLLIPSWN